MVNAEKEETKKRKLRDASEAYERVICKALSEIGKELYLFNFSKEIVKFVLRFAYRRDEIIRNTVTDFVRYFMSSDNPSTYIFKMLIMEHFGKLFKQRKFVITMHEDIFEALTMIYVDDSPAALSKEQRNDDTLDERITQMREKKKKNKLSKTGEKLLKKLEDDRRRRNERRKRKGIDDPRLQKSLKKELAQSEAIIDPVKVAKMVSLF